MEITELAAACHGLELARRFDINNVRLEGDSMNMMYAIAKMERGIATIHSLYDDVFD